MSSLDTAAGAPAPKRKAAKSKKSTPRSHTRRGPPAAGPPIEHRDKVVSLQQFADINNFSLATARRIIDRGEGPPLLRLSLRRVGIRESDLVKWQQTRRVTR
jgi:hypothetical protein